jgi:transposase
MTLTAFDLTQEVAVPSAGLSKVIDLRPKHLGRLTWWRTGLRQDLRFVVEDMVGTWAPDDFWQVAQPLLPVPAARRQGGGKRRVDDRTVLAAIVYLVQAGCSWHKLPTVLFGVSRASAHRRFTEWTQAGLWERLHQAFLHRLGVINEIDWSRAVVDSISVRAEKDIPGA